MTPGILVTARFPNFLLHVHLKLGCLGACPPPPPPPQKIFEIMYSELNLVTLMLGID